MSENSSGKNDMEKKLTTAGWSLFFIWIGVVMLIKVSSGVGLLGIGLITIGMQGVRRYFSLKIERFWLFAGLMFIVGSLWQLFDARIPLVPIVIIVGGAILFLSVIKGLKRPKE